MQSSWHRFEHFAAIQDTIDVIDMEFRIRCTRAIDKILIGHESQQDPLLIYGQMLKENQNCVFITAEPLERPVLNVIRQTRDILHICSIKNHPFSHLLLDFELSANLHLGVCQSYPTLYNKNGSIDQAVVVCVVMGLSSCSLSFSATSLLNRESSVWTPSS